MNLCPHGALIRKVEPERDVTQRLLTHKKEHVPLPTCPICHPSTNRHERRAMKNLRRKLQRKGSPLVALIDAKK